MCGIAGQVTLRHGPPADVERVRHLLRALVHRGPDGEGLFVDPSGRAVLGMRRLAIIDLVTGDQPVFNEDRSIACVFNGEIYNFQLLRADLERRGHSFRTMTDTEAIVHLYEEHGVGCLPLLRGMFAFALWDLRDGSLLLARDRIGKKPIYYAELDGRLSFASEIHALYGLPSLKKEIDPVALDLYLDHSYIPAPHSIFQAIRKLPPAHYLTVKQGHVSSGRYWQLPRPEPVEASREELVGGLRDKLQEAVTLRLISDVPLGCFLSGGVDSSSVVALMSRVSAEPVKTFSIGFTSARFNELEYARVVAERFRTEHHEFTVEPDAVAVLPAITRHFGEPFGDSSALPTWYLSQLARQHVTVALNGDGGDELFGGYPWYQTALTLGRTGQLVPGWASSLLAGAEPWLGPRVARLGARLGMPPAERFVSLRRVLGGATKQALYSKGQREACGGAAEEYLLRHYAAASGDELARMQYTDMMTYLPEDLLVKVDRMTMAHSLEGRSPLLDHELIEFCARIPSALKVDGGAGKAIFREATADLFQAGFFDRPKMGFSIPLAEWLRGPLRPECNQILCRDTLTACGLEATAVRRVVDEHVSGKQDRSTLLWNLLALGKWAEIYL